jgi:hypothetical protein
MTKGMARNEQSHANEYVANVVIPYGHGCTLSG